MTYQFLQFELDEEAHELRQGGVARPVEPQVFDLLRYLVEHQGRLVTREELFEHVWHGRLVSEAALSSRIKAARQVVGDSGKRQAIIQTVSRRGFRFVAEVVQRPSSEPAAPPTPAAPAITSSAPLELPTKPSIAVLPFANLGADPEQEYFADGMVEDVIAALSKFGWLFVIARSSSFAYKGQTVDVRAVSQELGVRYLLEGSVRRTAGRLRVSAQLVDATMGRQLWADRYDRSVEDLFAIQDEATAAIVAAIAPEISQAEVVRTRRVPPQNLDAWGLYHQGLAYFPSGTKEGFEAAIDRFDRAWAADPDFVDALALAAHMRTRYAYWFTLPDRAEWLRRADEMLHEALRLDPRNCATNYALGRWHSVNGEHELAIARCEAAIEMNPNSAPAHFELARCLSNAGRFEESLSTFQRVLRLSPRDAHMSAFLTGMAWVQFLSGRLSECVDGARRALRDANPRYWADAVLLAALVRLGRREEAEDAKRRLLERRPELTMSMVRQLCSGHYRPIAEALSEAGLPDVDPARKVVPFSPKR